MAYDWIQRGGSRVQSQCDGTVAAAVHDGDFEVHTGEVAGEGRGRAHTAATSSSHAISDTRPVVTSWKPWESSTTIRGSSLVMPEGSGVTER